ncbi:hypothetical protein ANASTE_00704 [Anaerofustis stercorihominis DSM 17244]|uniref:Uncharacterized protein n=1 Tax=Anaerofustis stercorihominis DSM 17244 TaxID=445971 RepID=B1C7K2_9FIRM|nr:hypothetical protein [Anaerofustis stercorihominis]EDS72989.1 hypothetical protein ANASTE_00704 [Anaerofustis stercorihominis DSM 17244]
MKKDRLTMTVGGNLYLKSMEGTYAKCSGREKHFDKYLKLAMYEDMEEEYIKTREARMIMINKRG